MVRLLFVCLGNICRSPAAEGIMQKLVNDNNLGDVITVDSCGTSGYHEGEEADNRMIDHAARRGIEITSIARGIRDNDLTDFDFILTMDNSNYVKVSKLDIGGEHTGKIQKITSYCTNLSVDEVPDPYYGGPDGFENVLNILEEACTNLLNSIIKTRLN